MALCSGIPVQSDSVLSRVTLRLEALVSVPGAAPGPTGSVPELSFQLEVSLSTPDVPQDSEFKPGTVDMHVLRATPKNVHMWQAQKVTDKKTTKIGADYKEPDCDLNRLFVRYYSQTEFPWFWP